MHLFLNWELDELFSATFNNIMIKFNNIIVYLKKSFLMATFMLLSIFLFSNPKNDIQLLLNNKSHDKTWVDQMNLKIQSNIKNSPIEYAKYARIVLSEATLIKYNQGIVDASFHLAEAFSQEGKYDSARMIVNTVLVNRRLKLSLNKQIQFLQSLGIIYYETGKYDSALVKYQEAINLKPENEPELITAGIYNNRANVYSYRGDYKLAMDDYLKVAQFYEQNKLLAPLAQVYENIGIEIRNLKEYSKSIVYYRKSEKINKQINNLTGLAQNYANMGVSFKAMDSIKQALNSYSISLELAKKINNAGIIAQNLLNMGNIYEKAGDYKKAIEMFSGSLDICKESRIEYGIMLNYLNLGNTHFLLHKFDQSEAYFKDALKMTMAMKLPKEESQVYERMAKLYKAQGKYKEALENLQSFHTILDNISSQQQKNHILELEKKYETEKKGFAILELKSRSLNQRLIIAGLIVIALFLLLFLQRILLRNKIIRRDHLLEQHLAEHRKMAIEVKNKELNTMAVQMMEIENQLKETNNRIVEVIKESPDKNVRENSRIMKLIKNNQVKSSLKNEFEKRLAEVNQDFYTNILEKFPDLTSTELKICALLRLNLSTKEIAQITNRSIRTIDFTRNNIRKKMNLSPTDILHVHLISV